ncbi:unnamed protein product, partial [Onchocerca ochengi]|uniref:ATP-dependent DNA helicase n=1 Tax=Onchocerca ochengi TaxID=42157 RepID=A0A182EPC3_ONCOC
IHGVCSKAVIPNSGDIVVEVDEAINYPTKFLNSLDLPGMPPHAPQLKIDRTSEQRMARMGTERHAARLEDARLRARRSCSVASGLLCSEQNERNKL